MLIAVLIGNCVRENRKYEMSDGLLLPKIFDTKEWAQRNVRNSFVQYKEFSTMPCHRPGGTLFPHGKIGQKIVSDEKKNSEISSSL